VDRVHGVVDRGHRQSMVDRGQRCVACGHWSSPVLAGDGGGGRVVRGGAREVLTGDGGVAERRRTGGNEQRPLELVARAKEGVKELRREEVRCGESRGSHHPFIGVEGSAGEGWPGGVTAALMALMPLKAGRG
jgi:hypothetical protein